MLDLARRRHRPGRLRGRRVRGRRARRRPTTRTPTPRPTAAIVARGGTPVIFPSYGLNGLDPDGWVAALAGDRGTGRPVHRLRAGRDVRALRAHLPARGLPGPARRPRSASAPSTRRSAGRPSGTAWRSATRCGPTSRSSPATTWPSTWSCTGRDYLLGLSTFAPEAVRPARPAGGPTATPGFYELNDVLQYLGQFAFRAPVPGYRHDAAMFLHLRGWAASDATPGRRAPPAGQRPGRPGRHRSTGSTDLVVRYPQVKKLTSIDAAPPTTSPSSASTSRSTTRSTRRGALAGRVEIRDGERRDPSASPTGSRSCRWRAGTAPPTAARPTWCAGAGGASGRAGAGLVWGEATAVRAGRAGQPAPAGARRVARSTTWPRSAGLLAPGSGRPGCSSPTPGRWSRPEGAPRPRTAYAHPLLDARVGVGPDAVLATDGARRPRRALRRRRGARRRRPASTSST